MITRNVHQITFTDCIGKLGTKWLKNHPFKTNEIVWTKAGNSKIMQSSDGSTTTQGVTISEPTTQSSTSPLLRNNTRVLNFNIDISKDQDLKIDPTISTPLESDFKDRYDDSILFEQINLHKKSLAFYINQKDYKRGMLESEYLVRFLIMYLTD